jgi:hypothetical protein
MQYFTGMETWLRMMGSLWWVYVPGLIPKGDFTGGFGNPGRTLNISRMAEVNVFIL